ncbi:MAG: LysR family transcriptional regulator [Gemmataceae bacterium]
MDINQLHYFLKIVEHGNFTRAAEDCGISQPAISQQVAKLEEELGQPVLERQGRRVTLTQAGEVLFYRAEKILQLVDDAKSQITDDGQTGRLTISAIPTLAPYLLPVVIKKFREQSPGAHVIINEDTTDVLVKRCSQGEIDLGLLALPIDTKYLETEELFDEELLLLVPKEHPLAATQNPDVSGIKTEPFLLLNETHCLSNNVTIFCEQNAFHPVALGRVSQLTTIQTLVGLGQGISLIPALAAQTDVSDERVYLSLRERPTRTIVVCWNPYRFQSKLCKKFLECLREVT